MGLKTGPIMVGLSRSSPAAGNGSFGCKDGRAKCALWSGRDSSKDAPRCEKPHSGAINAERPCATIGWWCAQSDTNRSPTCNSLLTGKLTGNFAISTILRAISEQKTLCRSHFSANSLRKSGEINRTDARSKCGAEMMRVMLYEAAQIMLVLICLSRCCGPCDGSCFSAHSLRPFISAPKFTTINARSSAASSPFFTGSG